MPANRKLASEKHPISKQANTTWRPLTHIPNLIHIYPPICNYILVSANNNEFANNDEHYAPFNVLHVQHRTHLLLSYPGLSVKEIILLATHYHNSVPFNNQDGYHTGRYCRQERTFYITIRYHIAYTGVIQYDPDTAFVATNTNFHMKVNKTTNFFPLTPINPSNHSSKQMTSYLTRNHHPAPTILSRPPKTTIQHQPLPMVLPTSS